MTPTGADRSAFRRLMGRWPTGVSVVTSRSAEGDVGLTVNAFLSVSLEPPQVLISLTHDADTTPVVERERRFAVNLLAYDQRAVSERFALALPPPEKFRGVAVDRSPAGLPLLPNTLGSLECHLTARLPVADHLLLVGEVVDQRFGRDVAPLLFYRSGYAELEAPDRLRLPAPTP